MQASHTSDLHTHSRASDGTLTPTELVQRAHQQGVQTLALTDHDTLAGLAEARQQAQSLGIHLLTGVEMSCVWQGIGIHIVALLPDQQDLGKLNAHLIPQEAARQQRAHQIAERLARTLAPKPEREVLTQRIWQAAQTHAQGSCVGRPHFAQVLCDLGYVTNQRQAFKKYLGSGKVGDIKTNWPTLAEATQGLKEAGAVTVLAHPMRYRLTQRKRSHLLQAFQAAGGQGLEIVSGRQEASQTQQLVKEARALGLKMSWGSDFHKPTPWQDVGRFSPLPASITAEESVLHWLH